MIRDPLVFDVLFLLHIGKGLISVVSLSIVVHPNPKEVLHDSVFKGCVKGNNTNKTFPSSESKENGIL